MKQVLVGWGNPLAGDDALGWLVADRVAACIPSDWEVAIVRTAAGSWRVAESLLDVDRVVVVDAWEATDAADAVHRERAWPAHSLVHREAGHDASLFAALAHFGRVVPERMPREVVLVGVPALQRFAWSDAADEDSAQAIDQAVGAVLSALGEGISGA